MLSCNARNRKHRRLPTCLTRRIPCPPHLACSFPPHLIPLPPCTSTLHVLVRGVDTIPYKPWPSTSSSHSHSFSPRTHGFRSTTIPAVIMVKDPLIDFEEVVVGMRSLGSIPRPVGSSRDGSSILWSPSKLRARWGQFRSNQPRSPGVRPRRATTAV